MLIRVSLGHKYTSQYPDVVLCNVPSNPTEKLVDIFMGVARHEEINFHLQRRKDAHCISLWRSIYSVRLLWTGPYARMRCLNEHIFHADHGY